MPKGKSDKKGGKTAKSKAAGEVSPPFLLDEDLTVAAVADLRGRLAPLLTERGELSLDGGAVVRADAAGLQLLVAFMRAAEAAGTKVVWRSVSETLVRCARLSGLRGELHLSDEG